MVGNTILLKHAPQCPESALAIEQIFQDAGLPPTPTSTCSPPTSRSAEIIADPRVARRVGDRQRAGRHRRRRARRRNLKKVVLELGGSDAFIVLDTDDVAAVVEAAVEARMENAGQSCNAAKRFIVADRLYDEFVEQFTAAMAALDTGDPFDPATTFGPLSSEAAASGPDGPGRGRGRQGGNGADRRHRLEGRARSSRPPC